MAACEEPSQKTKIAKSDIYAGQIWRNLLRSMFSVVTRPSWLVILFWLFQTDVKVHVPANNNVLWKIFGET